MAGVLLQRIAVDGAILSAAASVLILASLRANPRMWLQDFPADIRAAVPAKTAAEKRQSLLWGLPFLVVAFGVPLTSCILLARRLGSAATFAVLWADAFGVAMVFNVVDLVVIDWLIVCWLTPAFVVIPGTAGLAGYKDYAHHFRGFLTGVAGLAGAALLIAGAAVLLRM